MLPHGQKELVSLAARSKVSPTVSVNGWTVDTWAMTDSDVAYAVAVYDAVLAGDLTSTDSISSTLAGQGIDLLSLLSPPGSGRELITRADIAEFTAAASLIAHNGCTVDSMQMPNIPKMSRRKSDSGIDVFDVTLDMNGLPQDLTANERLLLASVKHTLASDTGPLRRDVTNSLTPKELTAAYVTAQLRVLQGRLIQEGVVPNIASRVFLFLNGFPEQQGVEMVGIAVIDPAHHSDLEHGLRLLPAVKGKARFRIIAFPNLANVHSLVADGST